MFNNKYFRRNLFAEQLQYLENEDTFLMPAPKPEFKFTIIGTGMIGMEHIRVTLLEGRALIHGIYDTNPRSIASAQSLLSRIQPNYAPRLFQSLEHACTDSETDAILICTPNFTHLDILKVAIQSEKPIFLEKPMATRVEDAIEIYEISQQYNNLIQIGLQYRYKSLFKTVYAEAIQKKSIGDIQTMTIMEHRLPFLDKVNQWNKFSEYSGGTLVEKCCHYFDVFNLFAQSRPVRVSGMGDAAVNFKDFTHKGRKSDILDNAFINIQYENGIKAHFNLCMFSPMFHEEIILCGNAGRIRGFETEDFLPGTKLKSGYEMKCSNDRPSVEARLNYPTIIEESGHNGSTYFEHYDFIENIKGRSTSAANTEEGLWSIIVGAAAEKAVQSGEVVEINEFLSQYNAPL